MTGEILKNYLTHLEDVEWLSKAVVTLSVELFTHNTSMAKAELEEVRAAVTYIESTTIVEGEKIKKPSVAEAEKQALVETNNLYGELKAQGEAIKEIIQAMKKRVEVLLVERQQVTPNV